MEANLSCHSLVISMGVYVCFSAKPLAMADGNLRLRQLRKFMFLSSEFLLQNWTHWYSNVGS